MSLANHKSNFGIEATWSFFATSHGKNSCDGIGGTIKRAVQRASLQSPQHPILDALTAFQFCTKSVKKVDFEFIASSKLQELRKSASARYQRASIIPGTREYHHFQPLHDFMQTLICKRISSDGCAGIKFSFNPNISSQHVHNSVMFNDYVVSNYDGALWVGIVISIDEEQSNCEIKFMHPKFPSRSYHWPATNDIRYTPFSNIIKTVKAPTTATGRQYALSATETES